MDQELAAYPWTQTVEEPDEWYDKFFNYYVPLGPARTLLQAFVNWTNATHQDQAILMAISPPNSAPHSWSQFSASYQWRKRATAWDAEQVRGAADNVMHARQLLQLATVDAARTLQLALKNPKSAVAAAKEILDRGGVPSVTIHGVKSVPFTSDDMAIAKKELEEWENQNSAPKSLPSESG